MSSRILVLAPAFLLVACAYDDSAPPQQSAAMNGATAQAPQRAPMAPEPQQPGAPPTASFRGYGPVTIGMSFSQANEALNGALAIVPGSLRHCFYPVWTNGPAGVRMMIADGTVARIDVDAGRTKTPEGVGIGDSEARIDSLYPPDSAAYGGPRVRRTRQKYIVTGFNLFVRPTPADTGFRYIFDTEGGIVTRFRAGRRPEVSNVEGCS